jgi:hypothetical protein
MKRRWLVLAALAGLVAAAGAWHWRDGPRWRSNAAGPGPAAVLGFSRDGRTLHTAHGLGSLSGQPRPRLARWDVASGRLLGLQRVAWEGQPLVERGQIHIHLLPDERTVLVDAPVRNPDGPIPGREFHIHELSSGRRRAGPISFTKLEYGASAPDGRRFWAWQYDPARRASDRIAVFNTATGEKVHGVRSRPDAVVRSARFSPDGTGLAILWRSWSVNKENHPDFVAVLDVATGEERCRFDLPPRTWVRLRAWRDGRLYVEAQEKPRDPLGPFYLRRTFSFDVTGPERGPETEEPLLVARDEMDEALTDWERGPAWLARVDLIRPEAPPAWRDWLDWAARTAALPLPPWPAEARHRVRFLDPVTGHVRCELPSLPTGRATSDDGSLVAGIDPRRGVEVWDGPDRAVLASDLVTGCDRVEAAVDGIDPGKVQSPRCRRR